MVRALALFRGFPTPPKPSLRAGVPPASDASPARGGPRWRRPGPFSALDQEHSCWRSVAVEDFQGSADELVLTGHDTPQVEAFDDHHVGGKQGLMHRISGLLRTLRLDRQIVDADDLYPLLDTPAGRARVDRRELPGEGSLGVTPSRAVRGLEQDPLCARRQLRVSEPFTRHVSRSVERDDDARADQ